MKDHDINDDSFSFPEFICALNSWKQRCCDARNGHYKRAEVLFERSQFLGYILIYSTVFVTVFSFFSLNTEDEILFGITEQHIVVLIGCVAAVISGIVTQARFGERAEMHRSSGARYANLARLIESLQMKMNIGIIEKENLSTQADWIITEWNNLSEDSLLTPHSESKSRILLHFLFAFIFAWLFLVVAV